MSYQKLYQAGACYQQRQKFRELFGDDEVKVTKELCVKWANTFDWSWAAYEFFTTKELSAYKAEVACTDVFPSGALAGIEASAFGRIAEEKPD